MKILHIDSSILGEGSASRALTREIVAQLAGRTPGPRSPTSTSPPRSCRTSRTGILAAERASEAARNAAALEQFLGADVLVHRGADLQLQRSPRS